MLQIKEKPGAAPVAEMRKIFEKGIRDTPVLAKSTPLGIMEVNGKFSHYMDPDTDTMWIGFALGYRGAERILPGARSAGTVSALAERHSIEGVIRFMRSDPAEQVCVCCPPGGGHIFNRRVEWDAWDTGHPEHFGLGPDVLLMRRATGLNANEGKRVRVTIEVLEATQVTNQELRTYSFRAECQEDVEQFSIACAKAKTSIVHSEHAQADQAPDVCLEFQSAAPLARIQDILRTIPDGHVMLETLQECPLAENSLKRNPDA